MSLFAGVVSAAFLATDCHLIDSALLWTSRLWENSDIPVIISSGLFEGNNFLIMGFVFTLGILIEMIRYSDAAVAFVAFTENSIRSKKAAETSSLILSHCLCIDDYLSSLTVGSVMRHVTDRFRIPRAKLAFLTDSMAAPIAIITPISSWAAAIIGFLSENGVSEHRDSHTLLVATPSNVYLHILPYVFYSMTLVFSMWFVVRLGLRFGTMADHEQIAEETGNLRGGKEEHAEELADHHQTGRPATIIDFFMPLGTLLIATVYFLLSWGDASIIGGSRSLVGALQNAPISSVLFAAGGISMAISVAYYLATRMFPLKTMINVAAGGIKLMLPVNAILLLSWTLGGLLREDLHTGQWLASLLSGSIPAYLIPLIIFWNASLISLALGSSWATAAILFPIALPMVMDMMAVPAPVSLEQMPILLPVFGAILSGAVCGDHISLISETTIMATTSAGCDHMDHVRTQWLYAVPAFVGTSLAFLITGILAEGSPTTMLIICAVTALGTSFLMLSAMHLLHKRPKEAEAIS
ncbi:MAG: hypothetical protein H7A37_06375 [Chlamydiales bacterium]|nr:hypothetical protein [Chlamydiia bacterium]MCP5507907.1 hypothetical protein [Chlamydiales bacterium]